MTEKKRYTMVKTNLGDNDGVYCLIKKEGHDFCQVFGENTAKAIVSELNNLDFEIKEMQNLYDTLHMQDVDRYEYCKELKKENEQLKNKLNLILEKKYHEFIDGDIGNFKIEDLELKE